MRVGYAHTRHYYIVYTVPLPFEVHLPFFQHGYDMLNLIASYHVSCIVELKITSEITGSDGLLDPFMYSRKDD